jgi:hypothetical protein
MKNEENMTVNNPPSIKIQDKGYLRKIGLGLSISIGLVFLSFAFKSRTPWYGYFYGPGMSFIVFLLTRFRSTIEIFENELKFTGYVWVRVRETKIPLDSISKIVETKEGKEDERYLTFRYDKNGKQKKLKLYLREFPELKQIAKGIVSKYPMEFVEIP